MKDQINSKGGAGYPFELPSTGAYKPISGYGTIGNTRTAVLVGYDGSIDWCCMPNFSSPSIFAAILDHRKGGSWAIRPAEAARSTQSYLGDTNILRTEYVGFHGAPPSTGTEPRMCCGGGKGRSCYAASGW